MQGRRCPAVIWMLSCLVALCCGGLTGCETSGSPSYGGGGSAHSINKISFEIQSTGRGNTAGISINGEDRGDTPVFIRVDAAPTGGTAEDLVIKAVWNGGGNETEFTIPRGSTPQPIVRIGPNGEREY